MGKIKKINKIQTKLQKYFSSMISGIKSQTPNFQVSTAISIFHGRKRAKSLPLSTNFHFLNRCRHNHRHREPETVTNCNRRSASATLGDIDRYLFENFRSLYGEEDREAEEEMAEFDGAPSLFEVPVPAWIELRGSNRFFITPVSSGSLMEEAVTKSEEAGCNLKLNSSANFVENQRMPALIDLLRCIDDTPVSSRSLIDEAETKSDDSRFKSFNDGALKLNSSANSVENQNGGTPMPALFDLLRFFDTPVSTIEEAETKSEDSGFKSFNDADLKLGLSANFVENRNGGLANTLDDCIAVVTCSASLYEDFYQSMVDVTKARAKYERRIDWEFFEELLFTYLEMNEKEHYRFVLMAFVDLVVDLRQSYVSGDDGDLSGKLVVVQ